MNGVEILAEEVIYKTNLFNIGFWIAAGIVFTVFVVTVIVDAIQMGRLSGNHLTIIFLIILLSFAIGIITGRIVDEASTNKEIDHIEYQVIIDDSVSMNKFLDYYEIVGQNGKIYTVKERNRD